MISLDTGDLDLLSALFLHHLNPRSLNLRWNTDILFTEQI